MPHSRHWPAAAPFVLFGIAAIIAAGLICAVLASMLSGAAHDIASMVPPEQGSSMLVSVPLAQYQVLAWLAAYLVLVVGIAQIGLGAGQSWLANRVPSRAVLAVEFAAFNLGNAGVVIGTLAEAPALVDAGGGALVIALLLFLWSVRSRGAGGWVRYVYWLLAAILIVSIPVGLVLAHVRHG